MPDYFVGKCPTCGNHLTRAVDSKVTVASCLCPGRMDGKYLHAFGYYHDEATDEVKPHPVGPVWARGGKGAE